MASHRCIYAVGPENVSSMRYLIDNKAAFTSVKNDITTIKNDILHMLADNELKKQILANQIELYTKNHKSINTQNIIKDIFDEAIIR